MKAFFKALGYAWLASFRQHVAFLYGMLLCSVLSAPLRIPRILSIVGIGLSSITLFTFLEGLLWARREHKSAVERLKIIQQTLRDAMDQNRPPLN